MKYLIRLVLFSLLCSANAFAQTEGSKAMSQGSIAIITSPLMSLEGRPLDASATLATGGSYIVTGFVQATAEVATITIKNVANGSVYVVNSSVKAAHGASVAVGASIRVVAESTGYALMASGQMLAFVPNALGQMLLHQSQVR